MKTWFKNLDRRKRNIISFSFSILSLILIIISFWFHYILFLAIPMLILGLIFADWNKKDKLKQNDEVNDKDQYIEHNNKIKYDELKNNDYNPLTSNCNFECSLNIIALKRLKDNQFFNESDFDFVVDEKILEYKKRGESFFLKSKFNSFVSLDLETTGLNKENDRIVQIAIVKVINGEIKDNYTKYVNPKKHISAAASEVNGIYDSDVKNKKTIKELFPEIFEFIGDLPIVAHNAQFDIGFLRNEWYRYFDNSFPKHKDICTMKLWQKLFQYFQNESPPSSKLNALVSNLLDDIDIYEYNSHKHDAYYDALATAKVFMKIYDDNYLKIIKQQ